MDRRESTNTPSRSDANFSKNTFSDCKLNVGPQNTHYHERNTYNLTLNVRVPAIETRQPSRERATDDSEALPRKDEVTQSRESLISSNTASIVEGDVHRRVGGQPTVKSEKRSFKDQHLKSNLKKLLTSVMLCVSDGTKGNANSPTATVDLLKEEKESPTTSIVDVDQQTCDNSGLRLPDENKLGPEEVGKVPEYISYQMDDVRHQEKFDDAYAVPTSYQGSWSQPIEETISDRIGFSCPYTKRKAWEPTTVFREPPVGPECLKGTSLSRQAGNCPVPQGKTSLSQGDSSSYLRRQPCHPFDTIELFKVYVVRDVLSDGEHWGMYAKLFDISKLVEREIAEHSSMFLKYYKTLDALEEKLIKKNHFCNTHSLLGELQRKLSYIDGNQNKKLYRVYEKAHSFKANAFNFNLPEETLRAPPPEDLLQAVSLCESAWHQPLIIGRVLGVPRDTMKGIESNTYNKMERSQLLLSQTLTKWKELSVRQDFTNGTLLSVLNFLKEDTAVSCVCNYLGSTTV